MARRYSFPTNHWNWPVKLTHHHAVRAGNLIFTGGQVDLDAIGTVRNVGNLNAQCENSMSYMASLFEDLGVNFSDLVRLVVYYVGDASDEANLLDLLARIIGPDPRPVVNMISMPELCYPDMLIEIEGVAMRASDGSGVSKLRTQLDEFPPLPSAFSHVVRADGMVFTSDISALSAQGNVANPNDIADQTIVMMDRLSRALAAVGSDISEIVKVNTYFRNDETAQDRDRSAEILASYFTDPGPAATMVPLPSFPQAGLATKIAATAICAKDVDGDNAAYRHVSTDGHWNSPAPAPYKQGNICNNVIHVGGQISLDSSANVIHPDDMVAQTRIAMDYLERM